MKCLSGFSVYESLSYQDTESFRRRLDFWDVNFLRWAIFMIKMLRKEMKHIRLLCYCAARSQNNDAWDASSLLQTGIAFPQKTHTRKRKKLELKISPEEKVKRKSTKSKSKIETFSWHNKTAVKRMKESRGNIQRAAVSSTANRLQIAG
jgi:hypothetical protein